MAASVEVGAPSLRSELPLAAPLPPPPPWTAPSRYYSGVSRGRAYIFESYAAFLWWHSQLQSCPCEVMLQGHATAEEAATRLLDDPAVMKPANIELVKSLSLTRRAFAEEESEISREARHAIAQGMVATAAARRTALTPMQRARGDAPPDCGYIPSYTSTIFTATEGDERRGAMAEARRAVGVGIDAEALAQVMAEGGETDDDDDDNHGGAAAAAAKPRGGAGGPPSLRSAALLAKGSGRATIAAKTGGSVQGEAEARDAVSKGDSRSRAEGKRPRLAAAAAAEEATSSADANPRRGSFASLGAPSFGGKASSRFGPTASLGSPSSSAAAADGAQKEMQLELNVTLRPSAWPEFDFNVNVTATGDALAVVRGLAARSCWHQVSQEGGHRGRYVAALLTALDTDIGQRAGVLRAPTMDLYQVLRSHVPRWKRNGWKLSKGNKHVPHAEMLAELDAVIAHRKLELAPPTTLNVAVQ